MRLPIPAFLRAHFAKPEGWSNSLLLAGFTAISLGAGLVYAPAGLIVAGALCVFLAKLIASETAREEA